MGTAVRIKTSAGLADTSVDSVTLSNGNVHGWFAGDALEHDRSISKDPTCSGPLTQDSQTAIDTETYSSVTLVTTLERAFHLDRCINGETRLLYEQKILPS